MLRYTGTSRLTSPTFRRKRADLTGRPTISLHANRGFVIVLKDLSDIKIDVPDAVDSVAKFLARAVADDCLYPIFIEKHPRLP